MAQGGVQAREELVSSSSLGEGGHTLALGPAV